VSPRIIERIFTRLIGKCEEVGRLLGGMMAKANLFCGEPTRALHESTAEYFASDSDHW
jgi:hypothetical protein